MSDTYDTPDLDSDAYANGHDDGGRDLDSDGHLDQSAYKNDPNYARGYDDASNGIDRDEPVLWCEGAG